MTTQAAHLIDAVLPRVAVRQWVLSVPYRLRYLLAFDHRLCRAVLRVHVRVLLGFHRRRARRAGVRDGQGGAVTVIQRFGGGVNLHVHFHTLVLEGVFTGDGEGAVRFLPLPAPTDEEVARLLATLHARVTKGAGSRTKGLLMAYKLLDMAQARWRRLDGAHLLPLVRAGIVFVNGVHQEGKANKPKAKAA